VAVSGCFIDEWFGDKFYKKLPLGYRNSFTFGQYFWTHAYYPHENLELWRPIQGPDEATKTMASAFRITPAGQDAFSRTIPLASPKLETNEEFLVIRAKKRPVVLLMPEPPPIGIPAHGFQGRMQRRLCGVAQIYSLADTTTGRAKYSPSFVERVRRMEWPQMMFLPRYPGILEVDSLLRLDELQSVFTANLEPTQYSLGDDVTDILRGQLQYLFTGTGPPAYTDLRELLLHSE